MKPGSVRPRERAERDIDEALEYSLRSSGESAALAFIDALERAFAHLSRHPASGSLRYAHELDLPGLRCWPLRRHSYLVFYVDRADHVDVWRVLHAPRDIPPLLHTEAPGPAD